MAITARNWAIYPDPNAPEDPTLQITITTDEDIKFFRNFILQRALNLAPPEDPKVQDWLRMSDRIDTLLEKIKFARQTP